MFGGVVFAEHKLQLTAPKLLFYMLVVSLQCIAFPAFSQEPIIKDGKCPAGWYKAGGYCKPFSNTSGKAIHKSGKDCPSGHYSSGNYCKPFSGDDAAAIERKGDCPGGYYRSGNYCKPFK